MASSDNFNLGYKEYDNSILSVAIKPDVSKFAGFYLILMELI